MKYRYLIQGETVKLGDEWIWGGTGEYLAITGNFAYVTMRFADSPECVNAWKIRRPIKKIKLG